MFNLINLVLALGDIYIHTLLDVYGLNFEFLFLSKGNIF